MLGGGRCQGSQQKAIDANLYILAAMFSLKILGRGLQQAGWARAAVRGGADGTNAVLKLIDSGSALSRGSGCASCHGLGGGNASRR